MTALPMIRGCFAAQWRGLDEGERVKLNARWTEARLTSASVLKASHIAQLDTPIWSVCSPSRPTMLTLVSVKEDFVGDAP